MAKFNYKAKDKDGNIQSGTVDAASDSQAASEISQKNLIPIEIKAHHEEMTVDGLIESITGVSVSAKAAFTRQLATMMAAGLPLTESLNILQEQVTSKKLKEIMIEALHEVSSGAQLSAAFSKYPNTFSQLYISLLRAGEASGSLDKTLIRLAEQMEQERDFRGKITGALLYPAIVVTMMVTIAIIMMIFVIPKIASVYTSYGDALPLPTQILIVLSNFVQATYALIPLVIVGVYFGFRWFSRSKFGNRFLANLYFKVPVFGPLNQMVTFAIMVKTFGTLVGSGIPILDGLRITQGTVGDNIYGDALGEAAKQVERGVRLSIPIKSNKIFPPIIGQMISIGEETGQLDDLLAKLAVYFEGESSQRIKNLTTALEPIIIVIMGVGVAALALAILLPLFNLVNVIK